MLMAGGSIERVDNALKIMEPMILPNLMFIYKALPMSERYETIVPFLSTCNMFMRRSDCLLVGGFDPSLKMFEDNELCFHLNKLKDGHFHQDLDTLVFHAVSPTGRDEGVFYYFEDHNRCFPILLSTRTILLARYRRWLLLVLPFLDLITLPVIFFGRLRKKRALSRIKQAQSTSRYKFSGVLLYLLALHHILALGRFFKPS
jgi:GT2 family glycosyltransferase